jgi:hypothetical protein
VKRERRGGTINRGARLRRCGCLRERLARHVPNIAERDEPGAQVVRRRTRDVLNRREQRRPADVRGSLVAQREGVAREVARREN